MDSLTQRRDTLARLLQAADDIEVVASARNAHEGLQAAQWALPDAIVTDVSFSDMDSLRLIEALARQQPKPRIIIVSVVSDAVLLRGALLAGARQVLPFPPKPAELLQAVRGDGV